MHDHPALEVTVLTRFADVDRAWWDSLDHGPSPFLRAGFLEALEVSGSVGPGTGWQPLYLVLQEGGVPAAAVACFIKTHSYGEYVFDFAWARAAGQFGVRYYPKLVVAAPFSPVPGRRVLIAPGRDRGPWVRAAGHAVRGLANQLNCTSAHWLFCQDDERIELEAVGYMARLGYQFHWHDRAWGTFDGFTSALKSRKRKQVRKERARVVEAGVRVRWRPGADLDAAALARLDRYYRTTVDAHGGEAYLQPGFFEALAQRLPEAMWMVDAEAPTGPVAGALCLTGAETLYGRYWGTDAPLDCLHFEVAYYAGIDRCLSTGLARFEAGAQGEHKLARGFLPTATHSVHWLAEPRFAAAAADACRREAAHVRAEIDALTAAGPFSDGTPEASDG